MALASCDPLPRWLSAGRWVVHAARAMPLPPLDASCDALQIFDKALVETTFTELYAELCSKLNASLPEFEDPESDEGKKITLRRLLLNKCQASPEPCVPSLGLAQPPPPQKLSPAISGEQC